MHMRLSCFQGHRYHYCTSTETKRRSQGMKAKAKTKSGFEEDLMTHNLDFLSTYKCTRYYALILGKLISM